MKCEPLSIIHHLYGGAPGRIIDHLNTVGAPVPKNAVWKITREELPVIFKSWGYEKGAEIGVAEGRFCRWFIDLGFEMYLVDPWKHYPENEYLDVANTEQAEQDERYRLICDKYKDNPRVHIAREESRTFLKKVLDNSLDFVYIDANHDFGHVWRDITGWSKKVKIGGTVAGHDFAVHSVARAVLKFFMANGITNWRILFAQSPISWMYKKCQ